MRRAFTLVELLVVIAIIGILIALLLPDSAGSAPVGPANAIRQQSQAIGIGDAELSRRQPQVTLRSRVLGLRRLGENDAAVHRGKQSVPAAWDETQPYFVQPNLGICQVPIQTHICPSDISTTSSWGGVAYAMANFNYAVNLGNTSVYRVTPLDGVTFQEDILPAPRRLPVRRSSRSSSANHRRHQQDADAGRSSPRPGRSG